ncbi:PEP-CTERM sorting domain-containing protein [Opitutaceae bacterium TAV4]|nr:PEP-CTERM sorting domain-containing protein [Opitutaceae bacterium TAV4]RRJ98659.1 PEP-CTERM sorting domain-containing protein [Opitutaceae bacterium TAV3]
MKNITKTTTARLASILSIALLIAAPLAHAIVVTDPVLSTGSGAMNKDTGKISITKIITNSTSQSVLEATEGFAVIKSGFAGFEKYGTSTNTLSFTDNKRPDVRFSISGTSVNTESGRELTNLDYLATSTGMRLVNGGAAGYVKATIEFGSLSGTTFTTGEGVAAVGFLLTGPNGQFARVTSITATFISVSGTTLSTQTMDETLSGAQGLYFGYKASGTNLIGSVELTVNVTALASNTVTLGLNNFGFAPAASTVPEPAHAALLAGLGIVALVLVRHIRQRR